MGLSITSAQVLVDWHSVQSRMFPKFNENPRRYIPHAVLRIQQEAARVLSSSEPSKKFRASLRFYHGWHRQREIMPVRKDFENFQFDESFARRIGSVSFARGFEFGNQLSSFDTFRPIFHTLRSGGKEIVKKMVDTSIVCDALNFSRFSTGPTTLIMAEDDDFIPSLLTSRAWGGKCCLLRVERRDTSVITDDALADSIFIWDEK